MFYRDGYILSSYETDIAARRVDEAVRAGRGEQHRIVAEFLTSLSSTPDKVQLENQIAHLRERIAGYQRAVGAVLNAYAATVGLPGVTVPRSEFEGGVLATPSEFEAALDSQYDYLARARAIEKAVAAAEGVENSASSLAIALEALRKTHEEDRLDEQFLCAVYQAAY